MTIDVMLMESVIREKIKDHPSQGLYSTDEIKKHLTFVRTEHLRQICLVYSASVSIISVLIFITSYRICRYPITSSTLSS